MECRDIERLIDAYLDRELPAEMAEEVESHLSACETCRGRYGGLVHFLATPEPIAVPAGLAERIAAAIESPAALEADRSVLPFELAASENGWHGQARRPKAAGFARGSEHAAIRRWLPWAVAAAACLAFFLMGWFGSRAAHEPEQQIAMGPEHTAQDDGGPVIVSPFVLASWAQAMAMGGPAYPLVPVLQAAATEAAAATASFEQPLLLSPRQPTSREVPPPVMELPQELLIIPHVSRALGV